MLTFREVTPQDAERVHQLYLASPHYFGLIGTHIPNLTEVEREVYLAALDPRRTLVFLCNGEQELGYLDYKMDYPQAGDVTINLLLLTEKNQSKGYGRDAVRTLEAQLKTSTRAKRILASVYGQNPQAVRFWKNLGYTFAIDARPIMEWYAKPLEVTA
ncbi:GNAT family N-acetyltransferase [Deinococcus roseus]|uniref:N-acetyltransferase n=1 Tax=Deinococcus roseus TaxID=392414 RepID=A0ABQ2CVY9_9DEIO|nr:GNAT family N-acetyltransferase [Deinococcus roseus]GGJ26291.1 N-acetyltransferase [Deinococcus roseus]